MLFVNYFSLICLSLCKKTIVIQNSKCILLPIFKDMSWCPLIKPHNLPCFFWIFLQFILKCLKDWTLPTKSRGWHPPPPLRTAYRSILALRTAYRHFLASRTAYRFTTKTTILAISIYIKKIQLQYSVCTCTLILENISFDVFAC